MGDAGLIAIVVLAACGFWMQRRCYRQGVWDGIALERARKAVRESLKKEDD